MPDIERRLADWRRALAETAGCSDDVLDELESHLRDEVERLVQTGEPEERALDLALSRLGPPQALGAEFAKLARGPEAFPAILHALGVPAPHLRDAGGLDQFLLSDFGAEISIVAPVDSDDR